MRDAAINEISRSSLEHILHDGVRFINCRKDKRASKMRSLQPHIDFKLMCYRLVLRVGLRLDQIHQAADEMIKNAHLSLTCLTSNYN